ncbi:MAG: cyanophycin synthetase, partial [Bacteroidota bacterium]
ADQTLFIYGDDTVTNEALKTTKLPAVPKKILDHQLLETGIHANGSRFDLTTTKLIGKHNALNALFAISIAQNLRVDDETIQTGLNSFEPASHRMEKVAEIEGVVYINDSKATNVDAVYYALDAIAGPIIWIAGGVDKGNDYEPLLVFAAERVRVLICMGTDNEKLKNTFTNHIDTIIEVSSAVEAVTVAQRLAKLGDTVLLSPACASFDLFENYIDRGDQFRTAVKALLPRKDMATLQSPSSPQQETIFSSPKNAQL